MTLEEYRKKESAILDAIKIALEKHLGEEAARILAYGDPMVAIATLRAFDKEKAKKFRERIVKLQRSFSHIAEDTAKEKAKAIGEHLREIIEDQDVKIRLPNTFVVKVMGSNYRFKITKTGKVMRAPIRRRKSKASS